MSGLDVLAKNTNLMVVGKPGSGKTTYLQRVVTQCNGGILQAHRIPVLIKLREFVEDGREVAYSLERYLERCWRLSDAETQLVLNRGRALVLLDGLDEVTGEDGKNITKEIKRFARAYPQVLVIVTCRTQSQESRFERFDYVEVADFDEPQVRAFAQHWFKTVIGDESVGLAKAQEVLGLLFLEENKPIRELAITPILLSLTCAVFHQTGKFYSKRSKLYEEGLELLLEQWDKSRSIERDEIYRDLSVERKLELLSYLAVKKFEQPQYVLFEQEEIEGYIAEFLGIEQRDSRAVLRAIESQHGLLIERSQKVWSFSHLTFQEYLVSLLYIQSNALDNLLEYMSKIWWREVFILTSQALNDSKKFVQLMQYKHQNFEKKLASEVEIRKIIGFAYKKSDLIAKKYVIDALSIAKTRFFYIYRNIALFRNTRQFKFDSENKLSHLFNHSLPKIPMMEVDNMLYYSLDYAIDLTFSNDKHGPLHLSIEIHWYLKDFYKEIDEDFILYEYIDRNMPGFKQELKSLVELLPSEEYLNPLCLRPNELISRLDENTISNLAVDVNKKSAEELDKYYFDNFDQLSDLHSIYQEAITEPVREWWKSNGETWISLLYDLMIRFESIHPEHRHLSEAQKNVLNTYFYKIDLIMECWDVSNLEQEFKVEAFKDFLCW
ncbi:NACHT domain-containing protein [Trichocoleus sp. FACHB-262]|nr:NACHT domain-containing protein [Trichocoleus sp. FACHB-262]